MYKFKFIDVEQNSDEWFQLRAKKITSSKLGCIMANYPKAFGMPAKKYAVNIALEQITGRPISNNYSNPHMDRGHEQEPIARMIYEDENFCEVTNGGFFDSEFIGCSPDGLVGDNGVIEIKSVISSVHFDNVRRGTYDPSYKWQFIGNLYFTGRDWIDFVSYCEQFPQDRRICTYRLNKQDFKDEIKMIDLRVEKFLNLIAETKETILNSSYIN